MLQHRHTNQCIGTYPINCSGRTSTNYTITYVPGTLTVTTAVQLTPASLPFATQNIGTTSPSQPATLRNIGGATMTFAIAITGDFVRGGGCGTTLAAGATCNVKVRLRTGTLTVTSALAGSGAVTLSGTGNGAGAAATPASNNFGGVTRGQVSAPFNFTVTNNGTTTLTFIATNAFTLGGTNAGQFVLTTGGSCQRRASGAASQLHANGHRSWNQNRNCQSSEQCHQRYTDGNRGWHGTVNRT